MKGGLKMEDLKEKLLKRFNKMVEENKEVRTHLGKNPRIVFVHLDGFTHSVGYTNDEDLKNDYDCIPYSHYMKPFCKDYTDNVVGEIMFWDIPNQPFQHNAIEYCYITPTELQEGR